MTSIIQFLTFRISLNLQLSKSLLIRDRENHRFRQKRDLSKDNYKLIQKESKIEKSKNSKQCKKSQPLARCLNK